MNIGGRLSRNWRLYAKHRLHRKRQNMNNASNDCSSKVWRVTPEQIGAVVKFLPELGAIAPEEIAHTIRTPEGIIVLGCVNYHPAVDDFVKTCYENGFVQPFDWPSWAPTVRRYMRNPKLVGSARLSTCIKLITAHIRCDRFCDCHLQTVLESGHICAILRRLQQFATKATRRN